MRLVPILAALAIPTATQAQDSGGIAGVVLTSEGGVALEAVSVSVPVTGQRVFTNRAGSFSLSPLPAGEVTVVFEVLGRLRSDRRVVVSPNETTNIEVPLDIAPVLLDRIQATAAKRALPTTEVAGAVSVIGRTELEELQAARIGDALLFEPGVEVEGAGPFLGLPVIRGLSGNRVLVLVDGQRLNNAREAINFGGVQPSLVDVNRIESVEVLRGPASVLYGTDAIGGIINIVTRDAPFPAEGVEAEGTLTTSYSTADVGRRISGSVRIAGPRFGISVDGTFRDAKDYDSPVGPVVNSGAESTDVAAALDLALSRGHHLRTKFQRFEAKDVGLPGAIGVFTASFPTTSLDKVGVEYRSSEFDFADDLSVSVSLQTQEENFSTVLDLPPFPTGPFNLSINTDTRRVSDVTTFGLGARAVSRVGSHHELTYGIDYFRDDVEEDRQEIMTSLFEPVAPGPPPTTEVETDNTSTTPPATFSGFGMFVQDEIDVGRWKVTPGLRFDRFELDTEALDRPEGVLEAEQRSEEAVSGSVSLLFRASESVRPVLSVGRAFRTPNVIERYFFGPGSQGGLNVPNPDLDNETSLNIDVGLKFIGSRARGSVTYFHNRVDDLISFVPGTFEGEPTFGGQPVSTVDNIGEARLRGLESEAELLLVEGPVPVVLHTSASWTDGKDLDTDDPLFVPPFKGVLSLRVGDRSNQVGGVLSARVVGDQEDTPEGFDSTAGFTVFDANLSLNASRWLGTDVVVRLGIENLTDKTYTEFFNSVLERGRNFETSLRVGFGG